MPPDASRDLRLGGRWSPWQRRKNDLIFALAQGALKAARRVPGPVLAWGCRGLGWASWLLLGSARRRVSRNLRLVFGATAPPSFRVFLALAGLLEDTLVLLRGGTASGERLRLTEEARGVFLEALREGRGVILATAHLGPWERLGAVLCEAGLPMATVARESYDPRFDALYRELREGRGLRVLYRGAPGFVAALRRALRANQIVGMPMDLGGRGVRVQAVPFFRGELPLAVGPAELARRTGAALIFATAAPGARGLEVRAERVACGENSQQVTRSLGRLLEVRLKEMPLPWPWMHRDLGGEPPLPVAPTKESSLDCVYPHLSLRGYSSRVHSSSLLRAAT